MTRPGFAHLRFADDVFEAVQALQRVGTLQAKPAREVYSDAPDGWFLVTMTIDNPSDVLALVDKAAAGCSFDTELLTAKVERDGDKYLATFFHLRGLEQKIH